jgi:predicted peptidase
LADEFVIQLPLHYREQAEWPLVVFLHGSGARGNDAIALRRKEVFRQNLAAICAAPQCLPSCRWEPEVIAKFIQHVVSKYRVNARRIYLVGHSMGAYGAWKTAPVHPELFAAIVPISGGATRRTHGCLLAFPYGHSMVRKTRQFRSRKANA